MTIKKSNLNIEMKRERRRENVKSGRLKECTVTNVLYSEKKKEIEDNQVIFGSQLSQLRNVCTCFYTLSHFHTYTFHESLKYT